MRKELVLCYYGRVKQPMQPENLLVQEANVTMEAFREYGFDMPSDVPLHTFFAGVCQPFMPEEAPPIREMNATPQTIHNFENEIQPEITRGILLEREPIMKLGYHVGRFFGAALSTESFIDVDQPFAIEDAAIRVDGHQVPFNPENGTIIEYGMGSCGMATHMDNIKADRYAVHTLQKTTTDTHLFAGMRDVLGFSDQQLRVYGVGIARGVNILMQQAVEAADLVVASNVHRANLDLRSGIRKAPQLLREDGVLLARGPAESAAQGYAYNHVGRDVDRDPSLHTVVDVPQITACSLLPRRTIIARKRA